jgi:hypothetical protein
VSGDQVRTTGRPVLTGCSSNHAASPTPAATTSHAQLASQPVQADVRGPGRYTVTVLMTTGDSDTTIKHMRKLARRSKGSLSPAEAMSLPAQSYAGFPNYRDANEFSAALFREHLEHVLSITPA